MEDLHVSTGHGTAISGGPELVSVPGCTWAQVSGSAPAASAGRRQ